MIKFTTIPEGQVDVSSDPRGGDTLRRTQCHLGGVLAKNAYTDSNDEKMDQIFKMRHFLLKNGVGKLYSPKITEDIRIKQDQESYLPCLTEAGSFTGGEIPRRALLGRCLLRQHSNVRLTKVTSYPAVM